MEHEISKMLEMASKLCEDEKYTQALKYYEDVLCVKSDNVLAIIDHGVTLQNLGHLRQALEMYNMALTIKPKNLCALINKGSVLHTLQKYSEAISCYNIVLSFDKKNAMAIVYKGLSIGEMGNIPLAMKYFKKALLIDNDYDLAQISLDTANSIMK